MRKSLVAALLVLAVAGIALSGCTATVTKGSTVRVAVSQAFSSYNARTSFGNVAANASIVAATNSQFNYYDNRPALQKDESFGTYQVVSKQPFRVKYTIRDGVKWSDGQAVDGADLLLSWAANSGALNTPGFDNESYTDPDTGRYTKPFPAGVVHFDGFSGNGLQLVSKTPVIGDDNRSLTLTYDHPFVDWELVFGVGLPAHVVAQKALGMDDATRAEGALVTAIQKRDIAKLSKIAHFWDTGFDFTTMPKDKSLVIGTGPYTLTGLTATGATLTANPQYSGDHRPTFERVELRFITDPLAAVAALRAGQVDVISPQPNADVAQALLSVDNATVLSGSDGPYEHLDLQFSHSRNGTFDDPVVRRAFLKTVPRQKILDDLIVPLQEEARLRSSQVFLPGEQGYAAAVRTNGSSAYATVDIEGAKELLAKAGVVGPQVCLLFDPSNPRRVAEYAAIQDSAALAGFTVTDCSSTDWRQLLGTDGAYDASLYALRPSSLAVSAVSAAFRSDSPVGNDNFYANPEVDALIDSLSATADRSQQLAILQKIDARVWADGYGVPLYQFPAVTAFNDHVSGVAPSPLSPNLLWNVWDWSPVDKG
ncbi:ABC transporter family substrate-binding protein [Glaciihabitans sp. INWT7]|uniref:ABC transporter family substrate-binding protein n=1 Tax=Glaciihabitans sp. INWT7 TaxID=2596912 RepID=UPI0016240583|nr:ABC transporter family substrate-binding protein [Glaciihabitans sp. INWT7]QNE47546.1 ABC transporter family substrate-binding protein [Glaciihabitans sp. INWT7]